MTHKYKITYIQGTRTHTTKLEATSKYNAKKRFYLKYPKAEIVKVEEME